jgi:hypothetical protein
MDIDTSAEQIEQIARKLVRYALSCEYSRQPIRRQEISAKVMLSGSRLFKPVFAEAQIMLKHTFGMEMEELPRAEKFTIQQKRAAQKNDKSTSLASNTWVLKTTLPTRFRTPEIIRPSRAPTVEQEAAYTGFYTFVVATMYLSGGSLSEAKLDRYLRRTNSDVELPIDRTDKVFARMIKDGYIVRVKDNSSGEELVDYHVGPRGKVEIGPVGAANFARTVWQADGESEQADLEARIERTLAQFQQVEQATQQPKTRGRKKAVRTEENNAEDSDEVMED